MSKLRRVSALLLERYNLGEVSPEEKSEIETALAGDTVLAENLARLRLSDREIRAAWPAKTVVPGIQKKAESRRFPFPAVWGFCAAALLLVIVLPLLRSAPPEFYGDRAKGNTELSVYLKTEKTKTRVQDYALVGEGNTIQLAYMTAENRYGVIFSIDGRSAVTLHYPYSPKQSTQLVPGKRTALKEAYTLDDAPDYEIFFLVTGGSPLDVEEILNLAELLARNPGMAAERSAALFKKYEVQTVTLRKE
jgi:hypothetical protein